MLPLDDRDTSGADCESVFRVLGGDIAAIDPWTRVDFSWLHDGASALRDAVGYRGLGMPFRLAGLTLGDADAAPSCEQFLVLIAADRLTAQACFRPDRRSPALATLRHWAAGSLSKHLQVVQFDDGDVGVQAELHRSAATPDAVMREFVTAFSWDVAALEAGMRGGELQTTEEWIRRATLSISRATPVIPLRDTHAGIAWPAIESPRGVFCSLQPTGGHAESDNVLYAVRRDAALLEPVGTLPGHRADWDVTRLTDVWLSRAGTAMIAKSLLCEAFVRGGTGEWQAVACDAVSAATPLGDHDFLLGLHDGYVAVVDGAQGTRAEHRLADVEGRFTHLVTVRDQVAGLVGDTVVGARLASGAAAPTCTARWRVDLCGQLVFDDVADLDLDPWSASPALAVLGDGGLLLLDAATGALRAEFLAVRGRFARFIGPGWLMVISTHEQEGASQSRLSVLDVERARWTEPCALAGVVTRVAVRGDEIHVGWANQSLAVWERAAMARGSGVLTLAALPTSDRNAIG